MSGERYAFGVFVFDAARGSLTRDGTPIPLGARALALLRLLLEAGNTIVPKADLIEAAWPDTAIEESNLSVQVAHLRKLLGTQPDGSDWISTVARTGYRFAGRLQTGGAAAGVSPARTIVAVLPFADATGSTDGPALADGLTEDIVT